MCRCLDMTDRDIWLVEAHKSVVGLLILNENLDVRRESLDDKIFFGLSAHGRKYNLVESYAFPWVFFKLCQGSGRWCLRSIWNRVNIFWQDVSARHGGSLEHGSEFCGAYLCDYVLRFNKVGSAPTLFIGDGVFGWYLNVSSTSANWWGIECPNC